jgi:uncharacterized GH25 family protein
LKINKYLIASFVLGIFLLFFETAFAHTLWLNASDYSPAFYPKFGARTTVYFGWGHHYPVDDLLHKDFLKDFYIITPNGNSNKLDSVPEKFLASIVPLKESGTHLACAELRPGFYTMHEENGKIHHKLGPKTGLKGVVMSLYYEQYAKALVNAGGKSDNSFDKKAGHLLEIIPLKNPSGLKTGDLLPVKVLFKGKPARFNKVYATYSGFSTKSDDFAYTTTTNGIGEAEIRILHYGPWLVKADHKIPATDELKDKCDELSYSATLTFEVP